MANTLLAQARQAYKASLPELFRKRNVVACGLGYKISEGQQTQQLSLMVSVEKKLPKEALSPADLIPQMLQGVPTDVVETGAFRAFSSPDPKSRYRPAQPGVSVGHYKITAGTLGLLVHRDGELFILSNNHVLANSNDAQLGDAILQPGPLDGGVDEQDRIAVLADFEPLDFGEQEAECSIAQTVATLLNLLAMSTGSSHRLQPVQKTPGENLMDAALARVLESSLVVAPILNLGLPTGVEEPELGQQVQKMGRTTGLTQGMVTQIDVTVSVDYLGKQAVFTDQIMTQPISQPGDSGSAILDLQRKVIGLLFAGSTQATLFTPFQRILDRFDVELVTT